MEPPFTHSFRSRRYKIVYKTNLKNEEGEELDGTCDPPSNKNPQIEIDPTLDDKAELETHVHEAMHAVFPDLNEDAVESGARDVFKYLWKLGYRKS